VTPEPLSPARQRTTIMAAMLASAAVAAALWWAVLALLPPMAPVSLVLALQCIGAATLFAFVPGLEAIAHERLVTPAIDPLAGMDSPRMKVNQRYAQNTLEQLVVFAAGLLLLIAWADARVAIAATLVWVLGRWAFWLGYHAAPRFRAIGLVGMLQSLLVLLFGVAHAAGMWFGRPGMIVAIALFVVIELVLSVAVMRPAR
jgi:hypothetical protein